MEIENSKLFLQENNVRTLSVRGHKSKPQKQLTDIHKNTGFKQEKKTFQGRVLVLVTAVKTTNAFI